MRRRQPATEHSEAVSRRLDTLRAELHGLQQPTADPEAADPKAHDPEPTHTRIRGEVPAPVPSVPWGPAVVQVPVPGRHASRRPRTRAVPPGLKITTSHAKVVALLCAVALAGAVWALTTGPSSPVTGAPTPAAAPLVTTPPDSVTPADAAAPGDEPDVTVDVAGKVRRPQIVVLPSGSRVVDAIKAAGGSRPGVDLTPINLARVLVDGEQIVVGLPAQAASSSTPPAGSGGAGLVNINTADQATLETLPGVGPVTAGSILTWRTDNAGFSSVDELLEVDGIGEATLAELAPLVTV